jgi:acetoin utilization deacetylase AcuC-like enzyme
MATGFVWHERYMWHDTGHAAGPFPAGGWVEPEAHAENPATKRRLKNLLDVSGLTPQLHAIEPRMASVDEVCRLHERAYVDRIKALSDERGGDAGGLTPFGPGSYEIALLAAGGVLAAVDAVLDGTVANAFALVRPPGHHALAGEGMGFCIFGNAALAALHLRSARGVARVAIVDWDVHHGNGTQAAFYSEPDVLTISLHQDGCFPPGSGPVEENGEGKGAGANINVPLPRGGGRGAYVAAFERVVVPALDRFKPDFLIIASGLDANAMDPLARMQMHSDGYRELTDTMLGVAARNCGGRLVVEHEGGYSSAYVPFCGVAIVEQLSGIRSGVEDPMLGMLRMQGGDDLAPHEDAAIARCEPLVERVPAA